MAFTKKTETAATENKTDYNVKVTRASVINDDVAGFDMTVNGIKIYNCTLRAYKNKQGLEGYIVNFPSRKSNKTDDNGQPVYYSYVWFPISKENKIKIIDEVNSLLG